MSFVRPACHRLALELWWFEILVWRQHWKDQRRGLVTLFGSCSSEPVLAAGQVAVVEQLVVAVQAVAVGFAGVEVLAAAAVVGDTSLAMKAAAAELHGMMTAMAAAAIVVYRARV